MAQKLNRMIPNIPPFVEVFFYSVYGFQVERFYTFFFVIILFNGLF